jgi:hypothetical protein
MKWDYFSDFMKPKSGHKKLMELTRKYLHDKILIVLSSKDTVWSEALSLDEWKILPPMFADLAKAVRDNNIHLPD